MTYLGSVLIKLVEVLYLRSLIGQLEGVDPRKMKHEEKLAFWINVHNALVMHVLNLVNRNTNSHDKALYNSVMISFFCTGLFGLWDSTEQHKESLSSLEGKKSC